MKKSLSFIAFAAMLCTLSGCASNSVRATAGAAISPQPVKTESTSASTSAQVSTEDGSHDQSATDETGQDEVPTIDNEIAAKFETPSDEKPDLSNAVANGTDDKEILISELTADNWNYVACNDYVYLAEPLGISGNSIENPDLFNESETDDETFTESVTHEYKRYDIGDKIGDLTLKECTTSFVYYLSDSSPKYFNGGTAGFDGGTDAHRNMPYCCRGRL